MKRIVEFESVHFGDLLQVNIQLLHQAVLDVVGPAVQARQRLRSMVPVLESVASPSTLDDASLRQIQYLLFYIDLHESVFSRPRVLDTLQLFLVHHICV